MYSAHISVMKPEKVFVYKYLSNIKYKISRKNKMKSYIIMTHICMGNKAT